MPVYVSDDAGNLGDIESWPRRERVLLARTLVEQAAEGDLDLSHAADMLTAWLGPEED